MRAVDYLPIAIGKAEVVDAGKGQVWTVEGTRRERKADVDDIPVSQGPAVIYRLSEQPTNDAMLDGPTMNNAQWWEIECRAPTWHGAFTMGDDILTQLVCDGVLLDIPARYDAPDDRSQQAGRYYAHILEVSLPGDGCPDEV